MKRRTRRILFWLAVAVFAVSSVVIIRYAQGYRYDFASGKFVLTGAIAVTANTEAKLFVDDKLIGSLSFLTHRGGDNRLLPGDYSVSVERDGYFTWKKEAVVTQGLLTDYPRVLLLPSDEASVTGLRAEASRSLPASFTLKPRTASVSAGDFTLVRTVLWQTGGVASKSQIATGVLGFAPSDNGDRVLWWTRNELWVRWTRDTDYQPYRVAGDRELVTRWSVPISRAAWFRDRDHIVVDLGGGTYRVVETDTRGGTNIVRF